MEQLYKSSQAVYSRRFGSVRSKGSYFHVLENSLEEFEAEMGKVGLDYTCVSVPQTPQEENGPTIDDYENYLRIFIEAAQKKNLYLDVKEHGSASLKEMIENGEKSVNNNNNKVDNISQEADGHDSANHMHMEGQQRSRKPSNHRRGMSIVEFELLFAARKLEHISETEEDEGEGEDGIVEKREENNHTHHSKEDMCPANGAERTRHMMWSPPPPSVAASPTIVYDQRRSIMIRRLYDDEVDRVPPRPCSLAVLKHGIGERSSIIIALEDELEKLLQRQSLMLEEEYSTNTADSVRSSFIW